MPALAVKWSTTSSWLFRLAFPFLSSVSEGFESIAVILSVSGCFDRFESATAGYFLGSAI